VAAVVLLPRAYPVQIGFLLGLRFLFGMFQAGTFPLLSRLIADWIPTTERGSAQGFLWMCSRGGGVLAPMVMVWLFHRMGNWRAPLVLGAGLGVIWCVVVWPWLRNRPEQMPRVNAAERALIAAGRSESGPVTHRGAPWGAMLRSTNVWALWWMYGFLGYSGNFFLFLFASYLQDYRHLDKDTAKWLTVVPFACGVFACISGGVLSDVIMRRGGDRRLGRRLVGACGVTLAGVMMLVSPWVEDVRWLAVVYGLTFLGNDLSMGPAWAAASDIGERHAGTLAGAMNMLASLMAAVAAVVAGQLFHASAVAGKLGDLDRQRLYLVLPFVLFAASYFLAALCWLRVDVTETIPQEAT
jgi:ACS family glucarate transporter-like MFS transporter